MATPEILLNLKAFLPELVVIGFLLLLFLVDAVWPKSRLNFTPLLITVAACIGGAAATWSLGGFHPTSIFSGALTVDRFGNFFRYLFFFVTALCAYLAFGSNELKKSSRTEFCLLLLCVLVGLSVMALSSSLLLLYIGIETVSIVSFVMAGFTREDSKSNEASFKYLVFGGLASGLMIYGFSLIYGIAGSLEYSLVAKTVLENAASLPLTMNFALLLVFGGLFYKISAFPMHFWAPDVYEGSPTPVTSFFSVAPKAAGFAALLRITFLVFSQPDGPGQWKPFPGPAGQSLALGLAAISALTMVIGNLSAIGQLSTKRLLAYSSIAHVGYMMMGLITFQETGVVAILFYLITYCAMNLGAFWIVTVVVSDTGSDNLEVFRGLGWNSPFLGVCMAIFLFSLTGIPLFAGFIGKFLLFTAVLSKPGFLWLAILGVLNSVVSLYYYAKILKSVWLEKPAPGIAPIKVSFYNAVGIAILAVPTIVLGLYFTPVLRFAQSSLFGL